MRLNLIGNMKTEIRNCIVCEKEITIKKENIAKMVSLKMTKQHRTTITLSDEGVAFSNDPSAHHLVWFCNDCWEKVRKTA